MVKNLEVLNGVISQEFDPLNNFYSVTVSNEIEFLNFSYDCDDCSIEIINNNYLYEGDNEVYVNVYNGEFVDSYTFYVYKEKSEVVFSEFEIESIESNSVLVEMYEVEQLLVLCLILIFITYKVLFHKKKHR